MRILVDIRHLTSPQQSGVGEYTTQLLLALFEIDQKNEYVLLSSGRKSSHPLALNAEDFGERIKHIHLSIPNKLLNLRTIFLQHPTFNWHTRESIDLIFLPHVNIVSLPKDIPTVLTVHDLSWHHFPEFYSKKMQIWHKVVQPEKLISQARFIITPSDATTNDVKETFGIDGTHISTISHGVDPLFTPTMQARDHGVRSRYKLPKRFALFVGTIEPRKNLHALIDGMKDYRARSHDDLHLVLVGKWGWRSHTIRHQLWNADLKNWAHYLGYVPAQDRPALYRSATVSTWPSLYEGFGLPVLEAMASGVPVITSRTSSLPELTQNAAILVDPHNSMDISDALKGLIGSNALLSQLKKRGLVRASQFTWKKTAQETLKIFEETSAKAISGR